MTKQISHAARALAIGMVAAALVLVNIAIAVPSLSQSGGGQWQYYRDITIKENSGQALTGYQVLVELLGDNFPSKAKSDGTDIRFTDTNDNELSYFIEEFNSAAKSAKIWVKAQNIPASGTTNIKMYYGNPSAGSSSNGIMTFEFFDDFDDGNYNGWNVACGSWTVEVGSLKSQEKDNSIYTNALFANGYSWYWEYKFVSGDPSSDHWRFVHKQDGNLGYGIWERTNSILLEKNNNELTEFSRARDGAWHNVEVKRDISGNMKVYFDRDYKATYTDNTYTSGTYFQIWYWGPSAISYFDNFRVRKYVSPEPTISLSAEQFVIKEPSTVATTNSYVYAGIGGLGLILVAIVALKRRNSSKVEETLKLEPTVKHKPPKPAPLTEPPKSKPAPVTVPEPPGVYVKTAFGYKGAAIIYKLKIENNTPDPVSDIKIYPYVPDVFLLKEKEKSIALIEPKSSQTVTFEIRPTGECGDCNVSGRMNYYDMATRKRQDIELEQKSLSIVCPMLHGKEIGEAEWHDAVGNLVKTEESTREIDMPAEALFTMVSRIIKDMHMHMQKPEVTQNHKLFNGVARFYGEGVKGLKYAAQVEVVGGAKKSKLILKAWAEKEDALTGFYHGILDEIEKRVNVKEYIDDGIVQYNVHIGDKIGTLVKDSVIQRSTIGASARKCPDCGREVEANEKFCLECGAKLGWG